MNENKIALIKTIVITILTIAIICAAIYGFSSRFSSLRIRPSKSGINFGNSVEGSLTFSGELKDILAEVAVADMEIKYNDSEAVGGNITINYKIPEKLVPTASLKDGKLSITSNSSSVFNLSDLSSRNYRIEIIIPKASVNSLTVSLNCGNININDLTCKTVSLEADCGNINLKNIVSEKLDIDADLGNVNVQSSSTGTTTIDADCGNIEFGSIVMEKVECDADLGNIEFTSCEFKNGSFNADMGKITVSGFFDYINAECSVGDIKVETTRPESEVIMDLDVDLGNVYVNGNKR